jgi:hypothetical protein
MSAANDASPSPIADDHPRAFAVVPRTAEPALLWVHADDDLPIAPPHAIRVDASTVETWLDNGLPSWLAALRSRGVAVACADAAHAGVHERVVRLREHVAPRTAEALWYFAEEADLPVVAAALAQFQPSHAPSFAELATMIARQPEPAAPTLARLCMALEHL